MMRENQKINLISVFFGILFLIIIVKLLAIAFAHKSSKLSYITVPGKRAAIYDRNGNLLASNIPTVSAYIKPDEFITELEESLQKILKIFPSFNIQVLRERIISGNKRFVWLKRHLSPIQKRELMSIGIPGIYLLKTERRMYPDKNLFSHILGGTDIDNEGIGGVEKYFNKNLNTDTTKALILSLDIRIQHIIRDELINGINKFSALGGVGIVMNVKNGQILAMVSMPDFDLNNITVKSHIFNQAIMGVFEPGSVAKIFNIAIAIDHNLVTLKTEFDITQPIKIAKFQIHDFHSRIGKYTVEDIVKYSSNIGSAHIAQVIGKERQQQFMKKLGLLDKMSIELPELKKPIVPRNWGDITLLTVSYGHGIAITPLHLICSVSGILNNGEMVIPTLLLREHIESRRVIAKSTSAQIKGVMRKIVVETSGKLANIKGYEVIGKTGTSEKVVGKSYSKRANNCFFVAKFDNYAILIMLDDPKGLQSTYGFRSANWNAAEVAGHAIRRIAPLLNIVPIRYDITTEQTLAR